MQNAELKNSPKKGKIGGDDAIFVRCAVQNLPIGTILRIKSNKFTNKIKKEKTVWEESLSIAKRER